MLASGRWVRRCTTKGKLDALTPRQRKCLLAWLNDKALSYERVLALLKSRFGVESSSASLSGYFRRHSGAIPVQPPPRRVHLVIELRSNMPITAFIKK
jgi:hypothetical protein